MVQWTCSFLMNMGKVCRVPDPLLMLNDHYPAWFLEVVFFSTSWYPTTAPVVPCLPSSLPASKTFFYVKKFLNMINKSSSTENRLIQLWMDPSSECLWAFVHSRYSNSQSLCHEPIVQLSVSQTKQQRRPAWIIRRLMPHEIYIGCYAFPVICKAL